MDIFLKALEVTFFVVARCLTSPEGTSYLGGGVKGMPFKTFLTKDRKLRNAVSTFLEPKNQLPRQG